MGLTVFKTLEDTQALIGELLLMIVKSARSAPRREMWQLPKVSVQARADHRGSK